LRNQGIENEKKKEISIAPNCHQLKEETSVRKKKIRGIKREEEGTK